MRLEHNLIAETDVSYVNCIYTQIKLYDKKTIQLLSQPLQHHVAVSLEFSNTMRHHKLKTIIANHWNSNTKSQDLEEYCFNQTTIKEPDINNDFFQDLLTDNCDYFTIIYNLLTQALDPCYVIRDIVLQTNKLYVSFDSILSNKIIVFYDSHFNFHPTCINKYTFIGIVKNRLILQKY